MESQKPYAARHPAPQRPFFLQDLGRSNFINMGQADIQAKDPRDGKKEGASLGKNDGKEAMNQGFRPRLKQRRSKRASDANMSKKVASIDPYTMFKRSKTSRALLLTSSPYAQPTYDALSLISRFSVVGLAAQHSPTSTR